MKNTMLFAIGGATYFMIEVLWRGYSHFSMFLLGGLCFLLIGLINVFLRWETPLWKQQLISTGIITSLEFIFGIIFNIVLKLDIWDYSNLPFNLLGQISLQFSIAWFFLSAIAIVLDDYLRYWFWGEQKPYYKLF